MSLKIYVKLIIYLRSFWRSYAK